MINSTSTTAHHTPDHQSNVAPLYSHNRCAIVLPTVMLAQGLSSASEGGQAVPVTMQLTHCTNSTRTPMQYYRPHPPCHSSTTPLSSVVCLLLHHLSQGFSTKPPHKYIVTSQGLCATRRAMTWSLRCFTMSHSTQWLMPSTSTATGYGLQHRP